MNRLRNGALLFLSALAGLSAASCGPPANDVLVFVNGVLKDSKGRVLRPKQAVGGGQGTKVSIRIGRGGSSRGFVKKVLAPLVQVGCDKFFLSDMTGSTIVCVKMADISEVKTTLELPLGVGHMENQEPPKEVPVENTAIVTILQNEMQMSIAQDCPREGPKVALVDLQHHDVPMGRLLESLLVLQRLGIERFALQLPEVKAATGSR